MHTAERRLRAMINPFSTAFAEWWCDTATRFALTDHGTPGRRRLRRSPHGRIFVFVSCPATSEQCSTKSSNQADINRSRIDAIDLASCANDLH